VSHCSFLPAPVGSNWRWYSAGDEPTTLQLQPVWSMARWWLRRLNGEKVVVVVQSLRQDVWRWSCEEKPRSIDRLRCATKYATEYATRCANNESCIYRVTLLRRARQQSKPSPQLLSLLEPTSAGMEPSKTDAQHYCLSASDSLGQKQRRKPIRGRLVSS